MTVWIQVHTPSSREGRARVKSNSEPEVLLQDATVTQDLEHELQPCITIPSTDSHWHLAKEDLIFWDSYLHAGHMFRHHTHIMYVFDQGKAVLSHIHNTPSDSFTPPWMCPHSAVAGDFVNLCLALCQDIRGCQKYLMLYFPYSPAAHICYGWDF